MHRILTSTAAVLLLLNGCRTPAKVQEAPKWRDGVYVGSNFTGLGRAKVEVTIKDGRIVEVKTLSKLCSSWFGAKAYGKIEPRIVEKQSPDVDAVTGATHSSHNIMNAVRDALRKAERKGQALSLSGEWVGFGDSVNASAGLVPAERRLKARSTPSSSFPPPLAFAGVTA